MSAVYYYSVVRVVPHPSNGEFVNIAVIVTDVDGTDTAIRQAATDTHVLRLGDLAVVEAARNLVLKLERFAPFGSGDLWHWHAQYRNIVQFSIPLPMDCTSAKEGLDFIWPHLVIEE